MNKHWKKLLLTAFASCLVFACYDYDDPWPAAENTSDEVLQAAKVRGTEVEGDLKDQIDDLADDRELRKRFHRLDRRWNDLLAKEVRKDSKDTFERTKLQVETGRDEVITAFREVSETSRTLSPTVRKKVESTLDDVEIALNEAEK